MGLITRNAFQLGKDASFSADGLVLLLLGVVVALIGVVRLTSSSMPRWIQSSTIAPGIVAVLVCLNRLPALHSTAGKLNTSTAGIVAASTGFGVWVAIVGGALAIVAGLILRSKPVVTDDSNDTSGRGGDRGPTGLRWTVRILGVLVLIAVAVLVGDLIRGHNPPTAVAGSAPAARSASAATTPPTTVPGVVTKGCTNLVAWNETLLGEPTEIAPTVAATLAADPPLHWTDVSAMETAPKPAYGEVAVDGAAFVQATSLAETNGDLVPLKRAGEALTRDCHILGLRSST
ncbi:MAG: hypothetical protein ACRDY3_00645 [Acidimicrobiales bacterium]